MKDVLKKLFPFISAAASLGGPLGTMAASAVGKAIGADRVDPTIDGIALALQKATPEQIEAIKQAENDFALKMQQLGFQHVEEMEKIAASDRDSAREREEKTGDSWTPRLLAAAVVVGFFTILIVMMVRDLPSAAREATLLLLGALSAAFGAIVQYYFGSSSGSDRKTELLATNSKAA